jgi:predicted transcriptional regulator of viral defense system
MDTFASPPRASGAALRLVRELVLTEGPIFTTGAALELGQRLGMSADAAYKALSLAAQSGVAPRLKGGLYRAAPPFGPAHLHEFAVATALVRPSVISGASALSHWGLVDQTPLRIVTASSPKVVLPPMSRGQRPASPSTHQMRHGWVIEGVTYVYRRIPESEMFGISDVWLDTETHVPIFDKERALLDTFLHPRADGGGHLGDAILAEHGEDLDVDLLMSYATTSGHARAAARIAAALQSATMQGTNANV